MSHTIWSEADFLEVIAITPQAIRKLFRGLAAGRIFRVDQHSSRNEASLPGELSRHFNHHQAPKRIPDQSIRAIVAKCLELLDVMGRDTFNAQEIGSRIVKTEGLQSIQRLIHTQFHAQSPEKEHFAVQ